MNLSPENTYGGGVFHLRLLEALADGGTECLIPLAFKSEYEPRKNWDVRTIPIQRTYKLGPIISNFVFLWELFWLWFVSRERFEVLRVTDPYFVGPAALIFSLFAKVTLVANVFHIEDHQHFRNRVIRFVCRRCDGVIVTSHFSKNQAVMMLSLDPDKVHVTYGGTTIFSTPMKTKNDAKRASGLTGKTVIGFIGALSERKNPGYLLEIFSDLHKKDSSLHLLFVGADAYATEKITARLKERTNELGLSENVTFTGRVDSATKATILHAMDLFAFPSLLEGFGLAVVEAMALGVPAVVSDCGSLPEVVEHNVNGLVLPLKDRERFAEEMLGLLSDPERLSRYGRNAEETVRRKFSWKKCAEETAAVYQKIHEKKAFRKLGIVLNAGDSLDTMKREGQLSRFKDHYLKAWSEHFDSVDVFSYGDDRDKPYPNVRFLPGRPEWMGLLYGLLMPLIHRGVFREIKLLRVMQAGAALPAIIAGIIWKIPMVVTYGYRYGVFMKKKGRPIYSLFARFVSRWALRRAKAIIVTTPALESHVRSIVGPGKTHLIPNGVDLDGFFPIERSPIKGKATAVFVGRLTPQKNLDLLASALAPIAGKVRLLIVGDGPEKTRLEKLFRDSLIETEFTGTIPHEELPRLMGRCDLFVLPSRIEGHPKALIEAMAMGLPCVGTMVEGTSDVLTDGVSGLLVPEDAAAFRDAVERLLADPVLDERLRTNARAAAEKYYDLKKTLGMEIELLTSIGDGL